MILSFLTSWCITGIDQLYNSIDPYRQEFTVHIDSDSHGMGCTDVVFCTIVKSTLRSMRLIPVAQNKLNMLLNAHRHYYTLSMSARKH